MAGRRIKTNVYDLIKQEIQFLELKPGTKIVEADLCERFKVSRTPIREALKRLEEEKFIDIYPQRGTYVSKIDFKLVKEITYMRHILETDIFMKLCEEKTKVSEFVEDKLLMMEFSLKKRDYKSYIQYDNKFHRALFECGGHEVIWDTISGFMAHYIRVLVLDMMMPDNLENSYASHLKIAECIENGDKDGLAKIMDVHHDHYKTEADDELIKQYPEYFV